MRAESPPIKYEWLARLRAAAVPPHAGLRNSDPPSPSLNAEADEQQSPISDDSGDEGGEDSEIETEVSFQATKSMPRLLDGDGKIEFFANTVRVCDAPTCNDSVFAIYDFLIDFLYSGGKSNGVVVPTKLNWT